MKIDSLEKLRKLAAVNQDVYDVLADKSIGRRIASQLVTNYAGTPVSEKLIRTWREKSQDAIEMEEIQWPEFFVEPTMPKPSGPTHITNAVYIPDPVAYREAIKKATTVGTKPWGSIPEDQAIKDVPRKQNRKKTSYNIVIMPDVQAPLHDEKLVNKFVQFLADYEPDQLGQVGDFTDSTEISRWVRGKAKEHTGDLKQGFRISKYILEKIRDVYDGQFQIVRSNHDDRLESYIEAHAGGLSSFMDDEMSIERLAGFNEYEVEFVRDGVVNLTPGLNNPWIMCHGDEGSMSPMAGKTAFNLAKNKFGANVVCGHTHRAGFTSESYGYNGRINRRLSGLEVGHFMDMTKADYLKKKGVAANWQQAFGIIEVCGSTVQANLIDVDINGNFIVDGVLY